MTSPVVKCWFATGAEVFTGHRRLHIIMSLNVNKQYIWTVSPGCEANDHYCETLILLSPLLVFWGVTVSLLSTISIYSLMDGSHQGSLEKSEDITLGGESPLTNYQILVLRFPR